MATKWKRRALPARSHAEVLEWMPAVRQSTLADFDNCHLTSLFGLEGSPFDNRAQARGHVFHRFAAEVLRTLRRTGEQAIPVEEALSILYEVCAQRDVPDEEVVVLPAGERRLLRVAAIKFAHNNRFENMRNVIDVEQRLYGRVTCVDAMGAGYERVITGTPDALIADPPEGAVVLDWKTTLQPPAKYEGAQEDYEGGVSYMGYFQQRCYALLVFQNYQAVQRVTLREFYPLAGEARTATVHRAQVEHLEREFAGLVELFDRAVAGGSEGAMWKPSPGRHCAFCPKPTRCPIEADARVFQAGGDQHAGGVTSETQARKLAAEYVLARRVKDGLHAALKSWVDVHGPVPVRAARGRYAVGWSEDGRGRRRFGVHVPPASDRGPRDDKLDEAFAQAAARREAAR